MGPFGWAALELHSRSLLKSPTALCNQIKSAAALHRWRLAANLDLPLYPKKLWIRCDRGRLKIWNVPLNQITRNVNSQVLQAHFPAFARSCLNNAAQKSSSVAHTCNLHMNAGVSEQGSATNVQTHAYPPLLESLKASGLWWILAHRIHELLCGWCGM